MQTGRAEYSEHVLLRAGAVDFTGRWRPGAILESMQDLATRHAELLGFGRAAMLERNVIWILSRTHLRMQTYPMMDEEVVAHTWPGVPNRFFFPRHFLFTRPDGAALGAASSLWLVLELGARAILPPSKCGFAFPDTSGLTPPLPAPERVSRVEGEAARGVRVARYTDLDINHHVNNTRYADWVCDALPLEVLRAHCVENLLLNYAKEVLPGQAVHHSLVMDGERFSMAGESEDGAQTFFEAGGTLAPWHSDRRV